MMLAGVVGYLLLSLGAPGTLAAAPAPGDVVISVAGPADARDRMMAAAQSLLATVPNLRWVTRAGLPTEEILGPTSTHAPVEIRIDVSDPARIQVYLPEGAEGGTLVRTLAREGTDLDAPMARESAAQIVKASVLALREAKDQLTQSNPVPLTEMAPPPAPQAPVPNLLYLRLQTGVGYLRTFESHYNPANAPWETMGSDSFSGTSANLNAAIGRFITDKLAVYGEVVTSTAMNTNWVSRGVGMSNGGPETSSAFGGQGSGRDLFLLGVGPGISYALPLGLYASGTFLFSKLWFMNANTDNPPPDTDWGIGGSGEIGAQRQLGRVFKLGIAAQAGVTSMTHHLTLHDTKEPEAIYPSLRAMTFALLVSGEYN